MGKEISGKEIYELHAEVCKTLSNPKRLEILNLLRHKEMTVSELAPLMGIRKANLSQHLAVMRERRIVTTRREGVNIYYSIANPKVLQACDIMREVLFEQLAEAQEMLQRYKK